MLIMQRKHQFPADNLKMTRPPPVPPRPDKSLVADALAKTRKFPPEYQNSTFPHNNPKLAVASEQTDVSPKLNGLSRVKSFIRDVISDKKSADEKKHNANSPPKMRKGPKEDSKSQLPVSSGLKMQKDAKQKFEFTPKKSLVRSLSSSLRTEQKQSMTNGEKTKESSRISKSNSFAEKAFHMRRAPPPPISPKPNKKNVERLIIRQDTLQPVIKSSASCEELNRSTERPIVYSSKLPKIASMDLNQTSASVDVNNISIDNNAFSPGFTSLSSECKKVDSTFDEKNIGDYVTRKLISEIIEANKPENVKNKERCSNFVSDLDPSDVAKNKTTIMLNGDYPSATKPNGDEERVKRLNDISNHELLISELEDMRREADVKLSDEQLATVDDKPPSSHGSQAGEAHGISRQSSVQSFSLGSISNNDDCDMCYADEFSFLIPTDLACRLQEQFTVGQKMAALRGLPPLPKSLSGFSDMVQRIGSATACREDGAGAAAPLPDGSSSDSLRRAPTTLDDQLAILRREMLSLRQLDLSLLSQLWTLNEAIHEWRQEVEHRRMSIGSNRLRPAPPPPPISPSSSTEEPLMRSVPSVEYVSS